MKYNAGKKEIRNATRCKLPFIVAGKNRAIVHDWCLKYPGDGMFSHHYAGSHWWFENEQDAIIFKLRWGEMNDHPF